MEITKTEIRNVLTRTTGYLTTVTSHSLQPYRGCSFGTSLCGVGCYVRHNVYVTAGRPWGSFLEIRENAADSYRRNVTRERIWARRKRGEMSIFLSSSTEPFLPQERKYGVTRQVLEAMLEEPPDVLVLQSHSHRAADYLDLYQDLHQRCRLRVHLSIETDRDRLGNLPAHGSPLQKRLAAARRLREAGIRTVVTVSPLLPIAEPDSFFAKIGHSADAVVIDHFIGGDGSADGSRTLRTPLPQAMAAVQPDSVSLDYRDRMVEVARRHVAAVGVGIDGFAGRFQP